MPNTKNPIAYAEEKLPKLRSYTTGDARDVQAWNLRALARFMPEVPSAALLGNETNGSVRDNTTLWLTGTERERAEAAASRRLPLGGDTVYDPANRREWYARGFHEVGVLGVEGGPAGGLVPGRGAHDSWLKLAIDDSDRGYSPERGWIREVLGRNAKTGPGEWVSIPDQVVIGVANLGRCARLVRAQLPPSLRWEVREDGYPVRWSSWVFTAASIGWSAGVGGAAAHLSRWEDRTRGVSEDLRPAAWLEALVDSGFSTGEVSHGNPAYSGNREWQKKRTGYRAALLLGDARAAEWLRGGLSDDAQTRLFDALGRQIGRRNTSNPGRASGGSSSGSSGSSSSSGGSSSSSSSLSGSRVRRWLGYVGGAAMVAGAAWWLNRSGEV